MIKIFCKQIFSLWLYLINIIKCLYSTNSPIGVGTLFQGNVWKIGVCPMTMLVQILRLNVYNTKFIWLGKIFGTLLINSNLLRPGKVVYTVVLTTYGK